MSDVKPSEIFQKMLDYQSVTCTSLASLLQTAGPRLGSGDLMELSKAFQKLAEARLELEKAAMEEQKTEDKAE